MAAPVCKPFLLFFFVSDFNSLLSSCPRFSQSVQYTLVWWKEARLCVSYFCDLFYFGFATENLTLKIRKCFIICENRHIKLCVKFGYFGYVGRSHWIHHPQGGKDYSMLENLKINVRMDLFEYCSMHPHSGALNFSYLVFEKR